MRPIILIPARLAATRLPGKPLADIGGVPMIVRAWRSAVVADVGPVVIAAGDAEIVAVVERAGGRAILTDPNLASGSDRIMVALEAVDPRGEFDTIVNLQGDMPFISPAVIAACLDPLLKLGPDISTLVAPEASLADQDNPDVVKAVLSMAPHGRHGRALYFTRSRLYGEGAVWRHVGIYGYRRAALERFTAAPPSALELREKLEQLRALELGLTIAAAVIDAAPLSVDTPADLKAARGFASR